jgi:hypothetical protein
MAFVATRAYWPSVTPVTATPSFNSQAIDATGEMYGFMGHVWNSDRATKNITKIGFRFGTVTKAGGSALTVSLQDVDVASATVYQPDGTQDQTVAIANADAGFTSNVWYQTAALSAARTVAFGELVAVVIEFDGAGRLGADAVNISQLGITGASARNLGGGAALKTGGTWALATGMPCIILEFDDGTFGTLDEPSFPVSSTSSLGYNSGSAADEVALEFTVAAACKCDGAWMLLSAAASADFEIVLYDGTTPLATASFDVNILEATTTVRPCFATFAEQTLATGVTYRLALKPTTANSVTICFFDVANANHFQAHPGLLTGSYTTRVNAGSWAAATTTRRPYAGIRLSAIDDGAGGGAAGVIGSANLRGGML